MYYLYRKLSAHDVLRGEGTFEEACVHLKKDKRGFVVDDSGNLYNTIEELENAKDIGRETGDYSDYFDAGESEISENTDRELFEPDPDRTE